MGVAKVKALKAKQQHAINQATQHLAYAAEDRQTSKDLLKNHWSAKKTTKKVVAKKAAKLALTQTLKVNKSSKKINKATKAAKAAAKKQKKAVKAEKKVAKKQKKAAHAAKKALTKQKKALTKQKKKLKHMSHQIQAAKKAAKKAKAKAKAMPKVLRRAKGDVKKGEKEEKLAHVIHAVSGHKGHIKPTWASVDKAVSKARHANSPKHFKVAKPFLHAKAKLAKQAKQAKKKKKQLAKKHKKAHKKAHKAAGHVKGSAVVHNVKIIVAMKRKATRALSRVDEATKSALKVAKRVTRGSSETDELEQVDGVQLGGVTDTFTEVDEEPFEPITEEVPSQAGAEDELPGLLDDVLASVNGMGN